MLTQIDGDTFITRLEIGNIGSKESCDRETKEFLGSSALTKNLSIENAYHTVLTHLENEKRIVIDDYNAEHVSKLKADVFRSNTWLMLFEDKAKKLKNEISAKKMVLHQFLSSFDFVCQEASMVLPLLPPKQMASPRKKSRQEMIQSSSKIDPASACCSLSKTLNETACRAAMSS